MVGDARVHSRGTSAFARDANMFVKLLTGPWIGVLIISRRSVDDLVRPNPAHQA